MKIEFKADELVNKNGRSYPVVGGRLRVAHQSNEKLNISTEMISYEPGIAAVVKATAQTEKVKFSAFGAASVAKDERLSDSLLELAETRAIARSLRFAGYGVEYTGSEEIPAQVPSTPNAPQSADVTTAESATRPQIHAIEKIATIKNWDAEECCRRILKRAELINLQSLTKDDASEVISRMKTAA